MKSFLKAAVFTTVLATALFVSVNAAQATPGSVNAVAAGAVVIKQADACIITVPPFGVVVASLQDVQTPSGNEKFTCHGQVDAGLEPTGGAVLIKDIPCVGFTGSGTGDLRVTPGGQVIVTCQIKK